MQQEGEVQKETEVLVDGKRGSDKRRCNNQLEDIDKRGHWQQKQQQLHSYATINKKKVSKTCLSSQKEVTT